MLYFHHFYYVLEVLALTKAFLIIFFEDTSFPSWKNFMWKKLWNIDGGSQGAKGSFVYTLQKSLPYLSGLIAQAAERLSPNRRQGLLRGDVYSHLALSRSQSEARGHSDHKTTFTFSAGCPGTPSILSVVVCSPLLQQPTVPKHQKLQKLSLNTHPPTWKLALPPKKD